MSTEERIALEQEQARIAEQIKALMAQQATLTAKGAALKKQEDLRKPVTLRVLKLTGGMVWTRGEYREDVVDEMKKTPDRQWNGLENLTPVGQWFGLVERLGKLENLKVEYADGIMERIERHLNAPAYEVTMHPEGILIVPGPDSSYWFIQEKLQHKLDATSTNEIRKIVIPFAEAHRIPEVFENKQTVFNYVSGKYEEKANPVVGVVYSADVAAFIEKQIKDRGLLDVITSYKDSPDVDKMLEAVGWQGKAKLFPFQRVGIEYGMRTGYRYILSDEVGLGKTVQAVALSALSKATMTLVVCPASLIPNWKREIVKWLGPTQIAVLKGSDPTAWIIDLMMGPRFVIVSYDTLGRRKVDEKLHQHTYEGSYKSFSKEKTVTYPVVDILSKLPIQMVLMDEVHYAKNVKSNRTKALLKFCEITSAQRLIPMTGHPIMNRVPELYPLLNIVQPGQFGSEEKFTNRYWNSSSKRATHVDELHKLIKHVFLRRRKKDVFEDLPQKQRITEFYELDDRDRSKYTQTQAGLYTALAEYDPDEIGGQQMGMMSILAELMRLKQICAAAKSRSRTPELAMELTTSGDNDGVHNKVLIFTGFKGTCYTIARKLGPAALCMVDKKKVKDKKNPSHFKWGFVTKDVPERDALVQQFQNDPSIKYLVVTEKSTREGHNITAAGHVVFNDLFWTPSAHEQAEGRAHARVGDMHGITAHYLVAEETIENKIMDLLAAKMAIIEEVIEGVQGKRVKDVSIVKELLRELKKAMWVKA